MDNPNPSFTAKVSQPSTTHLHYLERQQGYLLSLAHQLTSYHCVPKTVKLYEQMDELKRSIKRLKLENEQMIKKMRSTREGEQEHFPECQAQFKKVMQLEREILDYIGRAKIHG
jgi:hypothetical protein